MYLTEQLQQKWDAVLDHPDLPAIKDPYRKAVTALVLENQAQEMVKGGYQSLNETTPANAAGAGGFSGGSTATGPVAGFDPILISLVRRSLPNLIAYDIAGVQPMTGPTGLIFAMRTTYGTTVMLTVVLLKLSITKLTQDTLVLLLLRTLSLSVLILLTPLLITLHLLVLWLQTLLKI